MISSLTFLFFQDGITCLHLSKFCDHQVDCPDNSDEGHQCKQAPSCQKMKCSNMCSISWKGPKCYCPNGLIPAPDDPTACVDLNECEVSKSVKKAQKMLEIAKNWAYNSFLEIPMLDNPTVCVDLNDCEVSRHLHSLFFESVISDLLS